MNAAHWHLVVNHLPIIFPITGVLVVVIGLVSKSEAVKRTALLIFILGAIASLTAMRTGEGAEEVVENLAGVSEQYIHTHEEKAETFAVLSYILGSISIVGMWASFKQKSFSNILLISILLLAMAVLYLGKQTATTGGEIRHSEIRAENTLLEIDHNESETNENH